MADDGDRVLVEPVILGPNIIGLAKINRCGYNAEGSASGAFYLGTHTATASEAIGASTPCTSIGFTASNSNSLYGNSDTVQPEAYQSLMIIKD